MSDTNSGRDEAPAAKKKGKLLPIIIVLVLLIGGGGAAWFFLKPAANAEQADGEGAHADSASADEHEQALRPRSKKKGEPPIFVDMEAFVFNLQDSDQDRFAQVGITLEVVDAKVVTELAGVEPAVRNTILLLMSSKTSSDIRHVEGKIELAEQIIDATNAIMAGEEPPPIVARKQTVSSKAEGRHDDSRGSRHDRRERYIPRRVLHAHFKQFIVQ